MRTKKQKDSTPNAFTIASTKVDDFIIQFTILSQTEKFKTFVSFFAIFLQAGSQIAFLIFALAVPVCCNTYIMSQYVLQRALPCIGIATNVILAFWLYMKRYYDVSPQRDIVPEPVIPHSMSTAVKTKAKVDEERAASLSLWKQRKMMIEVFHDSIFMGTIVYFFSLFGPGASLIGCILAIIRCSVILGKLTHDTFYGSNRDAISIPVLLHIVHSLCVIGVWIASFISLITEANLYRASACYDASVGGWFSDNALCGFQYCGLVNNISTTIAPAALGGDVYSFCSVLPSSYKYALRPDGAMSPCCHWDRT
jgi:hypothetical protein